MNLNTDKPVYRVKYPKFYQSTIPFEDGREEILKKNSKSVPSPAGKTKWAGIQHKVQDSNLSAHPHSLIRVLVFFHPWLGYQ